MRISDWSSDVCSSDLVRPREILCVVGESGSGKSVTAYTVMGLLPKRQLTPTAGRLLLQGEDLLKATPARMRELRGSRMSLRSEERRVGKKCVGRWRSRWCTAH